MMSSTRVNLLLAGLVAQNAVGVFARTYYANSTTSSNSSDFDVFDYVDPLIGTANGGKLD